MAAASQVVEAMADGGKIKTVTATGVRSDARPPTPVQARALATIA